MRAVKKTPCKAVLVQYGYDLTSGERLTVGVLLTCAERMFVGAKFTRKLNRVSTAFPNADLPSLRALGKELEAKARILTETGQTDIEFDLESPISFYHTMFPNIDCSIILSEPIMGITADPAKTLDVIYGEYVGKYFPDERTLREDADVWSTIASNLEKRNVRIERMTEKAVTGRHYKWTFEHAWQNGRWNAVQPLSLDLSRPESIVEKAIRWSGKMSALHLGEQPDTHVYLVVGQPRSRTADFIRASDDGFGILTDALEGQAEVIRESDSERVVEQIARDLSH